MKILLILYNYGQRDLRIYGESSWCDIDHGFRRSGAMKDDRSNPPCVHCQGHKKHNL